MSDRFIRVNGKEFSFEEVAKALGLEFDPSREPVQVQLCQRVKDGVLVAKGSFFDNDAYPCVDVELELPAEQDSMPVMISRTEQPRLVDDNSALRTFAYSRSDNYFAYFDFDTRPDSEVDKDPQAPSLVVSGDGWHWPVEVYRENQYVQYHDSMPPKEEGYKSRLDASDLEVGMVGTIKDDPDIKGHLRGKAFTITDIGWDWGAYCTIEGQTGTFAVYLSQMETVRMPEEAKDDVGLHEDVDGLLAAAEQREEKGSESTEAQSELPHPIKGYGFL